MSLLQSALDFLAGPGTLGAASRDQNDFVGQTVEMGEMKLRIRRVIAEGKRGPRWRRPGGAALRCGRPSCGPLPPAAGPASGGRCSAGAGCGRGLPVPSPFPRVPVEPAGPVGAPCHGTGVDPELEWTHGDHHRQLPAPHSTTTRTLCLRAASRHSLNSLAALYSPFRAHRPLVQPLSLTPSCPSPDTAPCSVCVYVQQHN